MSTLHLNDSHLSGSLHTDCMYMRFEDTAADFITPIFLLGNFVVGLPANVWELWLICHGTREVLASEIYYLSLAVCEILYCLGLPAQLYCMYSYENVSDGLTKLLLILWILLWIGRPMFQTCICVEHYVAVVHPLIFIRFKPLKYKVAQCAVAWCVFFFIVCLMSATGAKVGLIWFIPTLCMLLFCNFSVLCSLKRPGPGEGRRRGDKMKKRAFNIVLVHLACFLVNHLPTLIVESLNISRVVVSGTMNLGMVCGLVQPLLYLHRAGKLSCVREH